MSSQNQFGKRLKTWRKQRKLTQEKLAEAIDISVHSISAIERGINFPSSDTLEKLSTFFGIPKSEFYTIENENDTKVKYIKVIIGILYKLDEKDLLIIKQQVLANTWMN